MPATAPYQPITPHGSPDFPQANLSTRADWNAFDRPEFAQPPAPQQQPPMYPGAASMYARERQVLNGPATAQADPTEEFYRRMMEAQEFIAMHREAQAPLPQLPAMPQLPPLMDFAEWADERYPEFAGRYVSPELARTLHAQYESEMRIAQQGHENAMNRYSAEVEAAKYLMGGNGHGGRGGGNPMADALDMLKEQREWMPKEPEAPGSIEAMIAEAVFNGDLTAEEAGKMRQQMLGEKYNPPGSIDEQLARQLAEGKTPEEIGAMRGQIYPDKGGAAAGLPTIPPNTNEGMWWNMAMRIGGYKSLDDIPPDIMKELMAEFQRQRAQPMTPSQAAQALDAAGFDLGDETGRKMFDAQFGEGKAKAFLDWTVKGGPSPFEDNPFGGFRTSGAGRPQIESGQQIAPDKPTESDPLSPVDLAPVGDILQRARAGQVSQDDAAMELTELFANEEITQDQYEQALNQLYPKGN